MRPLQLTMQSFGPYKDRETIDFTALADCRLFVISGNTGAGKTTIFDAVCFALYGKASGEDRKDPRMLRSHFADDETHTSVELAFAVGSRTYRVFRQMPHRKSGNKSETGGRIELYETTGGREVPCDSRFTTDDVNRRLERIVGLTLEQFSQIVMLPQGEFRKLLTSETDDKEKILRRIFRTELYNRTEELFQEKTREQRALLQQERTALDVHVQQVAVALPRRDDSELFRTLDSPYRQAPQVVAALEEEGAYYAAQREELQQRRERLAQQATEREAAYHAAKALNERLALQERKREEQALLASRKPAMEAAEARQREAEQAARIEPYEERRRAAAAYAAEKRQQREAKLADAAAAAQAAELAERRYDEEAAREPERSAAARELERLGELAPAVRALAAREREAERIAGEERELAAGAAALERELEGALAAKRQLGERIRQAERDTAALPERKERLHKLRQQAKLLKDLLELERRLGEGAKLE
ncbi:MAG: AAA family ATPase, partial [Paenibacillaceae bacterium]|nr:AAA family ATPase [Paenibacillaceae bacterium]